MHPPRMRQLYDAWNGYLFPGRPTPCLSGVVESESRLARPPGQGPSADRSDTPGPGAAGMQWREGLGERRRRLLLSLLLCFGVVLQPAETLRVMMETKLTGFLNSDISLPCKISGYNAPELDIERIAVTWFLKTTGGNEKRQVYSVVAGKHVSHRNGAQLDENELKKGNATLSLPQIQLNEAGTYMCFVIVTPDRDEGTTILEIVAKPVVVVSPKKVTIERDKEKTVSCAVNKFYPESIVVQWKKNSKHTSDESVSADDICTGSSVPNEDGTFNITSKLRLQPSLQDDGNIYSCVVKHKSFSTEPVFDASLTVTEPQGNNTWIVVVSVLMMAVVGMIVVLVYLRWIKKFPPTTMAFVGNKTLKHLEENQLQCLFSGFRPKPLHITFFLTQPNDEKQELFSWNTKEASDPEQGGEKLALLKKQMFNFSSTLSTKKTGTFEVSCTLWIVPDVKELHKFDLSLEIRHQALPRGLLVEEESFEVIARPVLDTVQCSTDVPTPDESLTLTCRIYAFFPNALETCWWKEDEPVKEKPFETEPTKGPDGLFSCMSRITFSPKVEDLKKRFFCKARLKGSQQYRESAWQMNTLVLKPKVSKIECEPNEPELGKSITLSCVVQDFYPPECDICWRKGFEELAYATAEEPERDPTSNLYHRKSQVSFIPNPEDHAVDFIVEIIHCDKSIRNTYLLMLKGFPKVADIVVDPSNAEYGNTLCLTCKVMDFYPRDINIQWLDGDNLIRNGVATDEPVMKPNGCFSLTSRYRLVPTALDYNKSISFKVNHEKLAEPITKSVYLKLPEKAPVLSEIKATPKPSQSGESLILEISISDFSPRDIRVLWYKDWNKLAEYNYPRTVCIGENKLCHLTSQITFDPKLTDIGKTIRCEVIHPTTNNNQEKSFILKGRDFSVSTEQTSPSLVSHNHIGPSRSSRLLSKELIDSMKIECVTSSPKAGKKLTLRCFVPGKEADEADVYWYKGTYPVDEEMKNNCEDGTGFISYVTVETKEGEQECEIRCEVCVDEENLEKSYTLKLS